MKDKPTVKVFFRWDSLQPDRRQWKPSNPLLEPMDIKVVVNVPLHRDYVDNAEDVILSQLSASQVDVFLTPKGMRYCIDQIEKEMSDDAPAVKVEDNEEWEIIDDKKDGDGWE